MFLVKFGKSTKVASASDATITENSTLAMFNIYLPMANDGVIFDLFGLDLMNAFIFSIESSLCFFELITGNNCNFKEVLNLISGHELLCEDERCWKVYVLWTSFFTFYLLTWVDCGHLMGRDCSDYW